MNRNHGEHMKKNQSGGTIVGLIIGLVIGLGVALGVAVYVTKVPVPFLNKGAVRSSDQDNAEAQKNKNWNPNSPLYGKSSAASPPAAAGPTAGVAAVPVSPPAAASPTPVPSDPLGDLAKARAGKPAPAGAATAAAPTAAGAVDPFDYFIQAGAFRTQSDADAQRAKLAMLGWEARVNEREQSGRTVFRVRIGPFVKRIDAEQLKEKLDGAGIETALVRVQR